MLLIIISMSLFLSGFKGQEVRQKGFGDKWPFTVESGRVECRGYKEIILVAKGKAYALNGTASGSKKYNDLFEIWKKNPKIPGTRIHIGDMINIGLKLCK